MTCRLAFVLFALTLAAGTAFADERTLQNEQFANMGGLDFGAGLVKGEAIAASFQAAPNLYPLALKRVQFITAGPMGGGRGYLTIKIYEDGGGVAPGKELASFSASNPNEPVEGNVMFIQEVDVPVPVTINSGRVRVAVFAEQETGNGGLTIPSDPKSPVSPASTVCAILLDPPCQWSNFQTLGGKGQWLIRLVVDAMGMGGVTMDMAGMGGGDGGIGPVPGAPTVASITPNMVNATATDTAAVILGTNFDSKASVFLTGPKGPVTIQSALVTNGTSIQISTPAMMAAGGYDVVVQNPDGKSGSLPKGFTVVAGGCACDLGKSRTDSGALVLVALALLAALGRKNRKA